MGKFPALGQRKPNIFEVNLVSALHHSLFKPSPHPLATHLSLLSPATHTHTCLDVAEKTKSIRWTPAPTSFFSPESLLHFRLPSPLKLSQRGRGPVLCSKASVTTLLCQTPCFSGPQFHQISLLPLSFSSAF